MMNSMMSGISGLRNHQTAMDVVGNNIANVNTSGFKASRILFSQVFSNTVSNATAPNLDTGTGGTNPRQVGMGSTVASIDMLYTEGNIERTDNPLDVSIEGDGLFIVKDSASSAYTFTRAGAFGVDKNGNLVNSNGSLVCGWMKRTQSEDALEADGFATTMDVEPLNVYQDDHNGNKQIIAPEPTTAVILSGNLNSNNDFGTKVGIPMTLYDNYGNEIQATLNITKLENITVNNSKIKDDIDGKVFDGEGNKIDDLTDVKYVIEDGNGNYVKVLSNKVAGALKVIDPGTEYQINKWDYSIEVGGKPLMGVNGAVAGTLTFSNDEGSFGKLIELTQNGVADPIADFKLDVKAQYTANPDNNSDVYFDFSKLTQYAAKDSAYVYDSNGYPTGTLTEYSIGSDGIITGIYSNGKQQALGMLALASFDNYNGLKSVGNSAYTSTANSGEFKAVVPGDSAGSVTSNTLEMSNVDLSTEFTNLIIYQRGFQANSRSITTADEMLQELVNLKR